VNLLDALFLMFLGMGAWKGYRRGLISAVGGFFGFLGGIWIAGHYYLPFSQFLGEKLGLKENLAATLFSVFKDVPWLGFSERGAAVGPENGFPPSLWEPLLGLHAGVREEVFAHLLAGALLKLFTFLFIWAVVWWGVALLCFLLTNAAHLTFLGMGNRFFGAGLEALVRLLALVVIVGLAHPLVISIPPDTFPALTNTWNHSQFVPYLIKGWGMAIPVLELLLGVA